MTEAELQRLVTDLATALGWKWVHFRPGRTERGWRTPVEGPLGAGWPDLVLVRTGASIRELLFVELKGSRGSFSVMQNAVEHVLRPLVGLWVEEGDDVVVLEIGYHLWTPAHVLDPIETSRAFKVLR